LTFDTVEIGLYLMELH